VRYGLRREKLALVLVGLPARGKTYTGRKLARYLSWLGYRARVFNVGDYRRSRLGAKQAHGFFDPENREGVEARRELALDALEDMLTWLAGEGDVGIYDATNSTKERRALVSEWCERAGIKVQFIENVCLDLSIVEANIRATKLTSPDYADHDPDDAVADFRARIGHYENAYEEVADDEGSYVRVIDAGRQVVVNRVEGYLAARLVFFLMNLHLTARPIWLTRHGESLFNITGRIGGDTDLAPRGERYARSLAGYFAKIVSPKEELAVWTSSLKRTIRTGAALDRTTVQWRALDEIDAGICDGMTYAEIEASMPDEFAARARDKFRYRYPRGESYQDVINRLDPVIIEIERQRNPILIIAHQAVLRALYAYFMDIPAEACPYIAIPLHTVIELHPHAYGCRERRVPLLPAMAASAPSS